MLHAHKGSYCDFGDMILCVHRESGHVNFLAQYNLLKDCLAR